MLIFPSPEWVAAWVELANSDQAFRSAGAGWDGVVGGVIEADEAAGVDGDLYLRLVGRDGCWYENIWLRTLDWWMDRFSRSAARIRYGNR